MLPKRTNIWFDLSRILSPERIFILSFAGVILAGAITLYLPLSSTRGLSFVDALFTAASAVCVTGLVVIEIGQDLTFIGQVITITLFQVGGLGIITFSAFLFGMMGRGISFRSARLSRTRFCTRREGTSSSS